MGSVDWVHGAVKYDQNFQPHIDGLDYNHIDLSDITVGIDSIYFHDPTLRMYLRQVALKEKSGFAVTHLSGPIAMEDGAVKLPKFRLSTPYSDIDVELDMPLSLMEPVDPGKMRLRMNASLGKQDLMPFMADLPAAMRQRWPEYPLTVSGLLKGNMQHMDFHVLEVSLPTAFHATATGFASNLDNPDMLRADVHFAATTQNLGFVMAMLPRDMQRDYRIPPLSAQGRVKADGQQYFADITAREGRGTVKAKGSFHAARMRYDADIKVRDLNVHHFMPRDSIYTVNVESGHYLSQAFSGIFGISFLTRPDMTERLREIDRSPPMRWSVTVRRMLTSSAITPCCEVLSTSTLCCRRPISAVLSVQTSMSSTSTRWVSLPTR